ncbi:SCO family protein [Methylopila turkensis]|uniref:Photosynthetic protein synthase I n=1 Tax=Methylopila turkensis TaxID=1437816 RepID=A0A9W6JIY0_9HYPH|nr:SCO family protein [Methylopila turkensis]GLK78526.1 photosynthetic protein synthase I [Methylopila turkensis]
MRRWAAAVLLAMAAFAVAAEAAPQSPPPPPAALVMTPGPFTLTAVDGRTVDGLDLDGAAYGVFFGFTHCPDICPSTLADVTLALRGLGEKAAGFRVYFVALDAERDTPQAVGVFLSSFDPRIVGLTGTPRQLAEAAAAFGAVARKRTFADGGYTIEHTAALFLVDANGVVADRAPFSDPPERLAKRIAAVAAR